MKKNIIFLFILIFSSSFCFAESIEAQVRSAYDAKDYDKAIILLEEEASKQKESGLESAQLYYNLGNAYFRDNNVGKAILNYERAALLAPNDKDIKVNLEFSNTKIQDKFTEKDTFFLMSGLNAVQNLFTSNDWANISIFLFIILTACLAVFFFMQHIVIKKVTFYIGIVVAILLICANIFSFRQKNKIENRQYAIILQKEVPAYNAPNSSYKESFILHSGSKVKINKEDGDWVEVEIISGAVGWVDKDALEII